MATCKEFLEENLEKNLGVKRLRVPAEGLVVTGYGGVTPLGEMDETFDAMLEGRSGVKFYPVSNFRTNIAAPVAFNPHDHFTERELRGTDDVTAMSIYYHRQAAAMAKVYEPDGKTLSKAIDKNEAGVCSSTAIGSALNVTRIYKHLFEYASYIDNEILREVIIRNNSRGIRPLWLQEIFPHGVNAAPGIDLGFAGYGVNSLEACATGLSSIALLCLFIKHGYLQIGAGGGFENLLHNTNGTAVDKTAIAGFASMRSVLAKDIEDPQKASRPFDRDRDGFLMGAGGAVAFIENSLHARLRGVPALAEIGGFSKSTDGYSHTELDVDNVARTIGEGLIDPFTGEVQVPDLILTHSTSTEIGDFLESQALFKVFDKYLKDIPLGAIKSNIGHLLGGAGAVNLVIGLLCLLRNKVPPIRNLDNPRLNVDDLNVKDDPIIKHMNFIRYHPLNKIINSVLVLAYGFGGYNAAVLLRKPRPAYQLV